MREITRLRQAALATGAFALLLIAGTVGYALILGESLFDALYRTIITVYTAGLVSAPQSVGGKLFTIVLVVSGVAIFLYVFTLITELAVSGTIEGAWQRRRMRKRVDRLHDHYIICGYGRVGRRVAMEFRQAGVPYVVVDFSEDAVAAAKERDDLLVQGSGTKDENLIAAGIERAKGLVASSDSDVDNLYIVLSARAMRPDLLIVARAASEDAAAKLLRAGADRVVQPYSTAGQEMAKLVLKPEVAAFLEMVSSHGGPDLRFEEIEVTADCGHCGKSIRDLRIRATTGALVVGLRHPDGGFEVTPDPDLPLQPGDVLIAMGTESELRALEELFAPAKAVAR
ncbi:MAG: potassium channel protein [Thermoleophilia bacterium]